MNGSFKTFLKEKNVKIADMQYNVIMISIVSNFSTLE